MLASGLAHALDPATVSKLASGDGDEKAAAIAALVASGDTRAAPLLRALADGEMQVAAGRVLIVKGDGATDAVTGAAVTPLPDSREEVVVNNRLRRTIDGAIAALRLLDPDRETRRAAVKELSAGADEAMAPLVKKALEMEIDPDIKSSLILIAAGMDLKSTDKPTRLAAIQNLTTCILTSSRIL